MHADDSDFPDWPTDSVKGLWAYEPPRESKLSMEQLPIVWEAALPDHWGSWLRFALLTGMRKSETKRAFVQGDELVVENTKNHSNLRLPMTDAIEACFFDYSHIRRRRVVKCPDLFFKHPPVNLRYLKQGILR